MSRLVTLAGILLLLGSKSWADEGFLESLREHRDNVDFIFRDRILSPLPEADRLAFSGLRYFAPDSGLRLTAELSPAPDTTVFAMPAFNRQTIPYSHFGTVRFELAGQATELQAFRRPEGSGVRRVLLIPFRDPTNSEETYAGGRYLEIGFPLPEPLVVDFNRAMNPWCAYDPSYACPIPPPSNRLTVPIRAGEKRYP